MWWRAIRLLCCHFSEKGRSELSQLVTLQDAPGTPPNTPNCFLMVVQNTIKDERDVCTDVFVLVASPARFYPMMFCVTLSNAAAGRFESEQETSFAVCVFCAVRVKL